MNVYFIHTPRVAGNAIKAFFFNRILYKGIDVAAIKSLRHLDKLAGDTFVSQKLKLKDDVFIHLLPHENIYEKVKNETNKFCFSFVRNPWDRTVSTFFYRKLDKKIKDPDTFKEFVRSFCEDPTPYYSSGSLIRPQCYWLLDDKNKVYADFIGKYESIIEDFDKLCDVLKIEKGKLPLRNTSHHNDYTEYYDEETKKLVGEFYKQDIEIFGYEYGHHR